MKYKLSNSPLKLREFGRNIQMMVDYCKQLEDDKMRNALAHEIVRIMSNIVPNVREMPDYKEKLWDHFYHMADYNIKVESEFPMPDPQEAGMRPSKRLEYALGKPRFRQYGRNVELMIKEAIEMEDGDKKMALINLIANIMRQHLRDSDRDSNADATVLEHLRTLSKGKLQFQAEDIRFYQTKPAPIKKDNRSSGGKRNKSKKKYKRNRK